MDGNGFIVFLTFGTQDALLRSLHSTVKSLRARWRRALCDVDEVVETTDERMTLGQNWVLDLAREMREDKSLVKVRWHNLTRYNDCFVGAGAVTWLTRNCRRVPGREEATALCQKMLFHQILHHVHFDHGFHDDEFFYRFRDELPLTLVPPAE